MEQEALEINESHGVRYESGADEPHPASAVVAAGAPQSSSHRQTNSESVGVRLPRVLKTAPNSHSWSDFTNDVMQKNIVWIMYQRGIASVELRCVEVAAELLAHFIECTGREARRLAENAGRTEINFLDMQRALNSRGVSNRTPLLSCHTQLVPGPFPRELPKLRPRYRKPCISVSDHSWLYAERTGGSDADNVGCILQTAVRPAHIHPHMPQLPPIHTYECTKTLATEPLDGSIIHPDIRRRHLEDRLSVQMQLPQIMTKPAVIHPPDYG